ncbi:PAS domain-containing hybrid sensor histidine kinase/response regulator [Scleromatobacter humisilvae]|uniref:histidine kinase n=1 Tax=Scleromatobacter humisilvae TaxID=2897159 RepID=A0A9X2C2Q4_9BURK|nr:PAS domain S-box protein [Scleromatobacter humisilvae]MCK9686315.1 PAS domain S-box protein [Scleromatobacter humisilvae]
MDDSGSPEGRSLPPRALLAAIVDSSFDGVISKTLDGIITSWNAGAERIFGFTPDEAIGRQITMLVPPERLNEEGWILERLRAGERVVNFGTVRVRKDGRRIDVAVTSSPVCNLLGEIVGASKIVRDVSDARAAASALAQSEARLAAIVDSAMDGIITVDALGRIVVFNDAAAAMLLCPSEQAIGGTLDRFLPVRHRQHHASWMTGFGRSGTTSRAMGRPGQIDACRADGTEFPAEASISHVEVNGEQLYTVILRDVSELRGAQTARRALEAQLREAQKMEAIGTLAGGIAHDVNNALGAILGNAALAKEDLPAGHAACKSIEQIDVAAQRARAVVRQILAFSRRQAQELVVQPLAPILIEGIALFRSTLPTIVRLQSCPPSDDLLVRADANQIHQVLLNFCTNAWHALRGSSGQITVGAERVNLDRSEAFALGGLEPGAHAHLWVTDDGCGMDEQTRARIFDPFFTTKPRGEGTGLGLSVVHSIVQTHAGAIVVKSEPGLGATFSVYLPEPAEVARPEAAAAAEGEVKGEGRCVAYVDDDEVLLLMVERLLTRRGFQVLCFSDPDELLDRLCEKPSEADVVISDFNMPKMTGIELARKIAQMTPNLPVVVSSGYISDEMREDARLAGISALLEKEDVLEKLVPVLSRVLAAANVETIQVERRD